jgi:filamentous hemagglutinin family protein
MKIPFPPRRISFDRIRRHSRLQTLIIGTLIPSLVQPTILLQANPQGSVVVHGDVRFGAGAGGNLQIQQGSGSAIINWDSFSIKAGELTQFRQPGANSAVLNRVTGGNPTQIHGALRANGNVFVINPNGILVGAGGTIDVHGLVLSTLDVSNGEFLAAGDMNFSGFGKGVTNLGRINAIGGDVFLIGRTVSNSGSISAAGGRVGLAAGEEVLLTAAETATGERIFVRAKGSGVSGTGVLNDGTIEGAAVELKAHGNVYALAINNKGSIRATGVSRSGGRVFLSSPGGTVSNSGSIHATSSGTGSGGRIAISAAYAKVDGVMRAQAGKIHIKGTESVEVGGSIDASAATGKGGEVIIEGRDLGLGATAKIDASGDAGGGSVRIGGGLQGRDDSISNADTLRVADQARILANAVNRGSGGDIVLWSDGETSFDGALQALGKDGGNGGFAEVSGKRNLNIDGGEFELGDGGFLLLDPSNFTVSDSVRNSIRPVLNAGTDVVVYTNGGDSLPGNGDIILDSDFSATNAINGSGSLSLLAWGDLFLRRDLINNGTGNINLVAGWDGLTPSSFGPASTGTNTTGAPTVNMDAQIFSNSSTYGNRSGSLYIGLEADKVTPTNASTITIASRAGQTNVAGYNLVMVGDNTAAGTGDNRSAQIGYRATDVDTTLGRAAATGRIKVNVLNDISMRAGTRQAAPGNPSATPGQYNYVQIGHGGRDAGDNGYNHTGDIEVKAGLGSGAGITGNIIGSGGTNIAGFVHIGHGGHGGATATGSFSGSILVESGSAGRIDMTAGLGRRAFAQIGHGGYDVDAGTTVPGSSGFHSGSITVRAGTGVSFAAGIGATGFNTDGASYAQIGHGGTASESRSTAQGHNGSIIVLAGVGGVSGDITFKAGDIDDNYAQLGHGGRLSHSGTGADGHNGSIQVGAIGDILFMGGTGQLFRTTSDGRMYAQLGHGGSDTAVNNNVSLTDYLGRGHFGDILVETRGGISFMGGSLANGSSGQGLGKFHYAQLGHGGYESQGEHRGNITVRAGVNGAGAVTNGSSDIRFLAGNSDDDATDLLTANYVQLGHGGYAARGDHGLTGETIAVSAGRDIVFRGGASGADEAAFDGNRRSYAQLGNGGMEADNPNNVANGKGNTANIAVFAGRNLTFTGGADQWNYVQIGNGGGDNKGPHRGDIRVTTLGRITFQGGLGDDTDDVASYAQIGNGGREADGTHTGNISVSAGDFTTNTGGGITFRAGDIEDNYVQIGHGGVSVKAATVTPEGHRGHITVRSVDTIRFIAGTQNTIEGTATDGRLYAQIGHGGFDGDYTSDGLSVISATPVGHNGNIQVISYLGDVDFNGGDTSLGSAGNGLGRIHYAQIGHGGYDARGDHYGNIDVRAGVTEGGALLNGNSRVTFTAGSSDDDTTSFDNYNYAQIGHGGTLARGIHGWGDADGDGSPDGDISVLSGGDILLKGGRFFDANIAAAGGRDENRRSYVQIGHGGFDADRSNPGNDTASIVMPDGNTYLFDGYNVGGPTALERMGSRGNILVETLEGNVRVLAGETHDSYALIGHGGGTSQGSTDGDQSGNIIVRADVNGSNRAGGGGNIRFQVDDPATFDPNLNIYDRRYVQLGHGGHFVSGGHSGGHSGDITVQTGAALEFLAGGGDSYAQLGHGGRNDHRTAAARVTATTVDDRDADNIYNTTGTQNQSPPDDRKDNSNDRYYAGTHTGDIAVSTWGDIRFIGYSNPDNNDGGVGYVQIGHGGFRNAADPLSANGMGHNGDISVFAGGLTFGAGGVITGAANPSATITFESGMQSFSSAQIGHGGYEAFGNHFGNIAVAGAAGVDFHARGGSDTFTDNRIGQYSYLQIGHGGLNADYDPYLPRSLESSSATVGLVFGEDPTLNPYYGAATSGGYLPGALGPDGVPITGQGSLMPLTTFNQTYVNASTVRFVDHDNNAATPMIPIIPPNRGQWFHINAPAAPVGPDGQPVIGNSGDISVRSLAGDINLESTPATSLRGREEYVQVGHGGLYTSGDHTGNIEVIAQNGNIDLIAGRAITTDQGLNAYGQIGHGGSWSGGTLSGSITVAARGSGHRFTALGGTDNQNYVQVGHGGYDASFLSGSGTQISGPDGNGVTQSDTRTFVSTADIRGFNLQYWYNPSYIRRTEYTTEFGDNALTLNGGIQYRRSITGNILLESGDGIILQGGMTGGLAGSLSPSSYAQVGHGGRSTESDNTGTITLNAGAGGVVLNAGLSDQSFAQIGHGGYAAYGNYNGSLTITGGEFSGNVGLDVRAGNRLDGYAQIGHGGSGAKSAARDAANPAVPVFRGNSGNIQIDVTGDVSFVSGTGAYQNSDEDARIYSMLGHGGYESDVHHITSVDVFDTGIGHNGSIGLTTTGGRIFFGAGDNRRTDTPSLGMGEGRFHFTQLGHGGYEARGEHHGSITVRATEDVIFLGGSSMDNDTDRVDYAQLGHGGWAARGNQGRAGDVISVTAGGAIDFLAGSSQGSYVMLGNGGRDARGDHSADISVRAGRGLSFSGTTGRFQVSGEEKNFDLSRATEFGTQTSDNIYDLEGGNVVPGTLAITIPNGPTLGDDGRGNIIVTGGTLGTFIIGDIVGSIQYTTGASTNGRIVFNQDVNPNNAASPAAANLVLASYQSLENQGSWAQLGNGGYNADQADGGFASRGNTGNITVFAGGDLTFAGGVGGQSYAQLGHGGYLNDGRNTGDITLGSPAERIGGAVVLTGGRGEVFDAADAYAMIGHGGRTARGTHSGDIFIYAGTGQDPAFSGIGVQVQAGTRNNNFALIGHGGTSSRSGTGNGAAGMEGNSGNILVDAIGSVNLIGGVLNQGSGTLAQLNDDGNLYAQIGHGGFDADVSIDGVTVNGNGIGHHGDIAVISRMGDVNVLAGDHLRTFLPSFAPTEGVYDGITNGALARAAAAAGGRFHYALIGHGGYEVRGNHYGNISVHAGYDASGSATGGNGDVNVSGGGNFADQDGGQHFAQIGHGARTSVGDQGRVGEKISVMAGGNVTVQGGDGVDNYAMIGNGGTNTRGDQAGDIAVHADGAVSVLGGNFPEQPGPAGGLDNGYIFTGSDAANSIDRAANLLDNGDFNIRGNRVVGGSVSFDVYNDLGVKIGTVFDADASGQLRVVADFTEQVGGVQYVAGQQVGTVTSAAYASGGTVTVVFTSDINPGADDGVPNLVLHYKNGQTDRAFAQIGHGGYDSDNTDGDVTLGNRGNISVTVGAGDLLVRGGSDDDSSATIGHGGRSTAGANIGDITVRAGGNLDLRSGTFIRTYASIGHGGWTAPGNHSGVICIHVGKAVNLDSTSGNAQYTYTNIGHGGQTSPGNLSGFITVVSGMSGADGGITLQGGPSGGGDNQFAQIGHGGTSSAGNHGGDITVIDQGGGGLTLIGGGANSSYAMVGHGDGAGTDGIATTAGTRSGNLFIRVPGAVVLTNGTPPSSAAVLGHRSTMANQGITAGTVQTTLLGGSINPVDFDFSAFINRAAFGGATTIGTTASNLVIDDLVSFNSAYALNLLSSMDVILQRSVQNSGAGDLVLVAGWNGTGGLGGLDYNSCQPVPAGTHFDQSLLVCDDFGTGNQGTVFVGDGTQIQAVAAGSLGNISARGHAVRLLGSDTVANGYAQLGFHSTVNSTQGGTGTILVDVHEGGLQLHGGAAAGAFTQVGNGGAGAATNDHGGAITISFCEAGAISLGGGASTAYAQIGHGGAGVAGVKGGDISLSGFNALELDGGTGTGAYAQVGHGGRFGSGKITGAISVQSLGGDISLKGGSAINSAVQIGSGGESYFGTIDSAIGVASTGALSVEGGSGALSAALIGNGGANSGGQGFSGGITVQVASDLKISGGSSPQAFAQIGHGGASADAPMSGSIVVSVADSITLAGTPANGAYGKIGHGDDVRDGFLPVAGTGSRNGDITVGAGNDLTMNGGLIGHRNAASPSTVAGGVTQIGVSRDDPTDPNGGNLVADATSQFQGEDSLRFYLPRRGNNQIAPGALLNGSTWSGAPADPHPVQRVDEYTVHIAGANPSDPMEHSNDFGTGPDPVNAAGFAFYYDTIVLGGSFPNPPQPNNPGVPEPPVPPTDPGIDPTSMLIDDAAFDEWLRKLLRERYRPGDGVILYEGFLQYGPNGESIFDAEPLVQGSDLP